MTVKHVLDQLLAPSLILLGAGFPAAAHAAAATAGEWLIPPVTHERARVENAAGAIYIGGDFNPGGDDCPRAFLRASGAQSWSHTPESLFAGSAIPGLAYLIGSSIRDLALDPASGNLLAAGEARLAWQDPSGPGLVTARGTYLAILDPAGNLLRDAYLGQPPEGPPPAAKDCSMICEVARRDAREHNGGDAIAADGAGGLVVAGWRQPAACDPQAPWDRDFYLLRYPVADLSAPDWTVQSGTGGDDRVTDLAIDGLGEIFMTGYIEERDRDLFVARIGGGGIVERSAILADPGDGEGHRLRVDEAGLSVRGFITGQVELDGQVLGTDCRQEIDLRFDRDLRLLGGVGLPPPAAGGPPGGASGVPAPKVGLPAFGGATGPTGPAGDGPPEPPGSGGDGHLGIPVAYEITTGIELGGKLEQLMRSDDRYLRIAAEQQVITLTVDFDPGSEPVYLTSVSLELQAESCYQATVSLGRAAQPFNVAGQRQMCPTDEPLLEVAVPRWLSLGLGFGPDGPPDEGLTVRVDLRFPPPPPPSTPPECPLLKAAEDQAASVDQIKAKVDY